MDRLTLNTGFSEEDIDRIVNEAHSENNDGYVASNTVDTNVQPAITTDSQNTVNYDESPNTENENNTDENNGEEVIIPNSESILVHDNTIRFSSALWFEKIQETRVILAGLGGIGSYVGFLLSRLNLESIVLYDGDRVDETNLSGQMYRVSDVGEYKAYSLSSIMAAFSDYHKVACYNRNYDEICMSSNIMICGFDNMDARKIFFESWKQHLTEENKNKSLFIDGRLAAEEFQILCIKGNDKYAIDKYEKEFLFKDSEAEETICSYKQTAFCANMIASFMVNLLVNFITNLCNPIIERDLPFFTSYNAELMYLKTEE